MKKKTVISVMVVAMLFAVSLFFVGGTYARYATKFNGNAEIQVAKWQVKLSNDDSGAKTSIDNLVFTVQDNSNVVKDKIAPSVKATAEVEVDLTGTEVAVDLSAEVTKDNLEQIFGESAKNVTLTAKIDEQTSGTSGSTVTKTINLPEGKAFSDINGKKKLVLELEWKNTDSGDDNDSDTIVGKAAQTLTIPVALTVQQHIETE